MEIEAAERRAMAGGSRTLRNTQCVIDKCDQSDLADRLQRARFGVAPLDATNVIGKRGLSWPSH